MFILEIQFTQTSILIGISSVLAFAHLYKNNAITFEKAALLGLFMASSVLFRVRGFEAIIAIIFPLLLIIASSLVFIVLTVFLLVKLFKSEKVLFAK